MDRIEQYIEEHSMAEDPLLTELDRATNLRVVAPKMLSGRVQGAFLKMLVEMLKPRTVLEIGTFTGYSALSMAAGLDDGAVLHTVEVDDELRDLAQSFFDRSPHGSKICLHTGSALEIAPQLVGLKPGEGVASGCPSVKTTTALRATPPQEGNSDGFDLVFIDGDKREYPDYYRMLMGDGVGEPLVHPGSVILADNVLWYGKVVGLTPGKEAGGCCPSAKITTALLATPPQEGNSGKTDRQTAGIVEFNRLVAGDTRVENVILPLRDGINLIRVK